MINIVRESARKEELYLRTFKMFLRLWIKRELIAGIII